MESSTDHHPLSYIRSRVHPLVVVACLVVALCGRMPESSAGWIVCPPVAVAGGGEARSARRQRGHDRRRSRRAKVQAGTAHRPGWYYLRRTWHIPLLRCVLLAVLWQLSEGAWPPWLISLPGAVWGWHVLGACWPWVHRQAEWHLVSWLGWRTEHVLVIGAAGVAVGRWIQVLAEGQWQPAWDWTPRSAPLWMGACVTCSRQGPSVTVERSEAGDATATLCGHFTLHVSGDDPFRVRMLALFLRQLEVPGHTRGSRRTRDGRTPFVRQQELAGALGVVQPDLSRWERYWLDGDWRRLLSLHTAEVLSLELQAQIVAVFATFPWWGVEQVHAHLQEQDVAVSLRQVRQAAQESGWTLLRGALAKRYQLTAESVRPRQDWLVDQLLAQVQLLLEKVEGGVGLTAQEQVEIANLHALADEVGAGAAPPPLSALPWLLVVERVLFSHWEMVTDGQVRCSWCASEQVARKSRKGRFKRFYDEHGQLQTVEVNRYYCLNPACEKKSFTNLPAGLVPYSPYRLQVHLLAVQMYAWGYSTYRRTATALDVPPFTVYRWVSALGGALLPVAALFGVVRSSGVVGIDEKFVLVPKNDKPPGKMRRWMYVYVAVDQYTYDLLHIAIYPHNSQASAHAFLLALRAKGYAPRVVVTDIREDYAVLIPRVFPGATHHECLFHAEQSVHEHLKAAYGADYARTNPQAQALKAAIHAIFDARTKRTAHSRYAQVMASREAHVRQTPPAAAVFDCLECHWPRLVNGIESKTIPRTNNATELVIRRFDQHYQNFCGFESIESTQLFLGVFEKLYRFTPFSDDAQPRLRGKCPLQLAGYDIRSVPMASICAGWSPDWPILPAPGTDSLVPSQ